jgi:hypothetical protein
MRPSGWLPFALGALILLESLSTTLRWRVTSWPTESVTSLIVSMNSTLLFQNRSPDNALILSFHRLRRLHYEISSCLGMRNHGNMA